jgi:hypothetical protein
MPKSDETRFVVNLPKDLHQELKIYAATNNTTIKDILIESARKYLDEKKV